MRMMWIGALSTAGGVAHGQSAAEHMSLGDRDRAALNLASAYKHFEAALALDSTNYDALVKTSQVAVELGEFNPSADQRAALFKSGEQYGRRAVAANANDADGHFELAQALGRNALSQGPRDRIKFAREVREQALEALKLNPKHSGALHVMGLWNAEVMRLNGFTRMIAKNFLGGQIFSRGELGQRSEISRERRRRRLWPHLASPRSRSDLRGSTLEAKGDGAIRVDRARAVDRFQRRALQGAGGAQARGDPVDRVERIGVRCARRSRNARDDQRLLRRALCAPRAGGVVHACGRAAPNGIRRADRPMRRGLGASPDGRVE